MVVQALEERARIVRAIRSFFDGRGFVEVSTPVRIAAPAPECHIDCPPVSTGGFLRVSWYGDQRELHAAPTRRSSDLWLETRLGERCAKLRERYE